jgi:hypothetical protein
MIQKIASMADTAGRRLNWVVERCCALLTAVMVLVVWFGVTERYFLHMGATGTEGQRPDRRGEDEIPGGGHAGGQEADRG